jgi:DNA-binding transcriptional LysR family regulator
MRGFKRCKDDFVLKQPTLDGLGLAMSPSFFVESELASGRLVRALENHQEPSRLACPEGDKCISGFYNHALVDVEARSRDLIHDQAAVIGRFQSGMPPLPD